MRQAAFISQPDATGAATRAIFFNALVLGFHGVLAPNAGLRAAIVPGPAQKPGEDAEQSAYAPAPMSWARLLKRVFDIDLEHCPWCGGEFRIIAAALTGTAAACLPGSLIIKT